MDSINNFFFKGYGKLSNPTGDALPPPPPPQPSRFGDRRHLVVVTAIFLLTLSLLFLLGSLIHESTTEPPPQSTLLLSNLTASILFVCRSTHHPVSCYDSIASSVNGSTSYPGDPVSVLRLSLAVCSRELDKVSGIFAELGKGGSSEVGSRAAAVEDCRVQVEDAVSRVVDSMRRIGVDGGIPSDDAMADVATWMSAAMTDGETCVDGLEEAGSTEGAGDQVKGRMRKAREYMSNSLAIAVNLKKIVREFDEELH